MRTKSRILLISVAEQAGLSLTWSKTPEDMPSHDVARLIISPIMVRMVCVSWLIELSHDTT